jgi:hypothetical protein
LRVKGFKGFGVLFLFKLKKYIKKMGLGFVSEFHRDGVNTI